MQESQHDVAVIGLGAMGAATVYQLARRGVDVVGIDRFSPPHDQGSSHGDTRITRQAVGEGPAYAPLAVRSQQIWRALEAATGVPLFERCGVLVLSASDGQTRHHGIPDFTQRTIDVARACGIEHETLGAAQIRARFAQFAPVLDSALGCYEPGGGYVRPERCIDVQLAQARRHGARLYTARTVTGLREEQGGVVIETTTGAVRARRAVVSAGMWNAQLLGAPFDRLLRVCRQTLFWFRVTEPSMFPPGSPSFILFHGPADEDSCYGFPPLPGEQSIKVATEQYLQTSDPDAVARDVGPQEGAAMFRAHLAGRILGVSDEVVRTAVCTYTVTPDSGFIIDRHPRMAGVTVVSACSGHGFKHSAAIGEALAERLVDGRSRIDLRVFSLARFG